MHNEFDSAALASVNGNVTTAQERLKFADQNITRARELVARPVAGEQAELVDTVRGADRLWDRPDRCSTRLTAPKATSSGL